MGLRHVFIAAFVSIMASVSEAKIEIIQEEKRDHSPELRSIPPKPTTAGLKLVVPNSVLSESSNTLARSVMDPVIQNWFGKSVIPAAAQSFDGIRAHGYIPPDTNGEAGLNHYVQMVNRQFAVFDKTGKLLYGPVNTNTLWTGFGGACETTNQGDPIVVYDQLANRWVITQFANIPGGDHLECVAVSTGPDPTGSYYRYAFPFPVFNDYPKIGVWPDAYYSTYILRKPNWAFVSSRICAFNRSNMLTGAAASAVCFDVDEVGLLPADLDGITPPPSGSPHFSMNVTKTSLRLWKMKVNWKNPGKSKLFRAATIPIAPYTRACVSAPALSCIPQPGVTQKLSSFSDRLMFRLGYRNFGSHESLFANHTVQDANGITGIRWYEVRRPKRKPLLYQQGTYLPDGNHRWMGSIGSDLNGNVGLGYSISSDQLHPGIRYTGRLVSDPKGTMPQGEGTIVNGAGSQTGSTRWGDYSALAVDPVDDCTFWYTTEYIAKTGSFNWRTRIGSFKFPSCGCAVPAGIANNAARDHSQTAFSGVLISWSRNPKNWGDNGNGKRTYDVLRNGIVIEAGVPYGTTIYVDSAASKRQSYVYSVRYTNGCGRSAVTEGAAAIDSDLQQQ